MSDAEIRRQLETFLGHEADCCDDWKLGEWLALWAPGAVLYEVGPLDMPEGDTRTHGEMLYLLSDDRFRLEQRIIRMGKSTAHAEYPVRSRIRHHYTHLRAIELTGDEISFRVNMLVTRVRHDTEGVTVLPGRVEFRLARTGDGLRIRSKRVFLDLQVLANPGTLSIIL